MPPYVALASDGGDYPSTIQEDKAGIEIETKEEKGKLIISNISFVSVNDRQSLSSVTLDKNFVSSDRSIEIEESDGGNNLKLANDMDSSMSESLYDTLTDSLLFCGSVCGTAIDEPKPIKSALKKSDLSKTVPVTTQNRSVQFKSLEISEYQMTLGDHPSACSGPPVTLDWQPSRKHIVDLEAYERARQPRRSRRQLRMSYQKRERVLLDDLGFSVEEVKDAWQSALEIRKQRYETLMQSVYSTRMEEAWESAGRKFWRMFNYE